MDKTPTSLVLLMLEESTVDSTCVMLGPTGHGACMQGARGKCVASSLRVTESGLDARAMWMGVDMVTELGGQAYFYQPLKCALGSSAVHPIAYAVGATLPQWRG